MRVKQRPQTGRGLPSGHITMAPHPDSTVDPPLRHRKAGTNTLNPAMSGRALKRQAKKDAQAEKMALRGAAQDKGFKKWRLEEAARALKASHALKVPLLMPPAQEVAQAPNEEQQDESAVEDFDPPDGQSVVVNPEIPTEQTTAASPDQVGCNRRISSDLP